MKGDYSFRKVPADGQDLHNHINLWHKLNARDPA